MNSVDWILRSTRESTDTEQNKPSLVEKILQARGFFSESDRNQFLYPKLADLKDPFSIDGMDVAVERLAEAHLRQEKICIYADFDLDGTSGLALMLNGLASLGFQNVIGYQPRRLKSGYGFHAEVVTELASQGVSLIVTVDVGITAHKAAATAKELGIDVIITDHHQPSETLPDAFVVVNPNKKNCKSGLGYLSGAGVAFYLLRALKRALDPVLTPDAKSWDMKSILDFFTIATLTDMVPLIEDNRVLIKHGLHQLAKTEHVGLRALLEELELLGRPLNSQDVGIRFAPKLNALSRMDSEILPIDLMMAKNENEARNLISRVMKNNQTRIEMQQEADIEAARLLESWTSKDYIFLASTKFHRGVIGLIANKLAQSHQVPVFVAAIDEANQKAVGSSRAPENTTSLVEILGKLSHLMERFGGHHAAAGFEFTLENLEKVGQEFVHVFKNVEAESKAMTLMYDAEAHLSELNSQFMNWYEFMGPFGQSFEVPLLKIKEARVESIRVLKGNHLKLRLEQKVVIDSEEKLFFTEALLFSPKPKQVEHIKVNSVIDLLVEPQWNYFGGKKSIQVLVKDFKKVSSSLDH